LIIDELLPTWDVATEHRTAIQASANVVYEHVRALDMESSWGIRQLFRVRGLPAHAVTFDGLQTLHFALLADVPPRELVLGVIGRFWTPSGELRATHAADFRTFSEPGYAKAVWNFVLHEEANGGVILSTHTRVLCLDQASRRSFRRYWKIIGPFSGWIRRRVLRIIKNASERARSASPTNGTGKL
jgi:hypothetical protein